jgi:GR25 family glycosyltransferase involved in LPS biosynthesis
MENKCILVVTIIILLLIVLFIVLGLLLLPRKKEYALDYIEDQVISTGNINRREYINTMFESFGTSVQTNIGNIPIYIINLKRSTARKDRVTKELKEENVKFKVIEAVDGRDIKKASAGLVSQTYKVHNRPIVFKTDATIQSNEKFAELGCTMSHLLAVKAAYENGDEYALVIEDDIYIPQIKTWDNTLMRIIDSAPKDWELISTSNYFPRDAKYKFRPYIVSEDYGTFFMLYNRIGMKKLINTSYDSTDELVNFRNNQPVADNYIPSILRGYVYHIPLMTVQNFGSEFDSTIHTSHTNLHNKMFNNTISNVYKNLLYTSSVPKIIHIFRYTTNIQVEPDLAYINQEFPSHEIKEWFDKNPFQILYKYGGVYIHKTLKHKIDLTKLRGLVTMFINDQEQLVAIATVPNHPFVKMLVNNPYNLIYNILNPSENDINIIHNN